MAASNFHLLYSVNPNLRHLATLKYKSSLAGQNRGIIAPQRDPFSSSFHNPESELRLRYPHLAYQLGSGKRGNMASVQVYPVGKRWNKAPRQFVRGAQRGRIAAGALGKMLLKPALGVAVPMLAKLGANQIGKLMKKKKKRQRGGNIRALAGQLVESPQFTKLLTDPLTHVTGMARRYGSEGIKSLQTKLARELRGSSQKGGSIKQRLTGDGKILARDFIRNAASLLRQDPTRNFVKSTVRKKVPIFKGTASRKAWGAVNSALRQASRQGVKMADSGRKQRGGGAFGIAAMLGKAILPTVAGAILEPALGGILKQLGLGGRKRKRAVRRATAMKKMFRAAMQRGGRGNSSSSTNAVIKQALQPASTTVAPAKKTKKKKSKSDLLWSVVNSDIAGKFANTFGQKASDAVLTKIFG